MEMAINHHDLDIEFIQYCELVFFHDAFESDLTKGGGLGTRLPHLNLGFAIYKQWDFGHVT